MGTLLPEKNCYIPILIRCKCWLRSKFYCRYHIPCLGTHMFNFIILQHVLNIIIYVHPSLWFRLDREKEAANLNVTLWKGSSEIWYQITWKVSVMEINFCKCGFCLTILQQLIFIAEFLTNIYDIEIPNSFFTRICPIGCFHWRQSWSFSSKRCWFNWDTCRTTGISIEWVVSNDMTTQFRRYNPFAPHKPM